jgi:hypothetical protein
MHVDPYAIAAHAEQFGEDVFAEKMAAFVTRCLESSRAPRPHSVAPQAAKRPMLVDLHS